MELICLAHKECLSISAGLPVPRKMVTNHQHVYLLCGYNCVCVCEAKVKGRHAAALTYRRTVASHVEMCSHVRGSLPLSANFSSLFGLTWLKQILADNQTSSTPALFSTTSCPLADRSDFDDKKTLLLVTPHSHFPLLPTCRCILHCLVYYFMCRKEAADVINFIPNPEFGIKGAEFKRNRESWSIH